MNFNLHVLGTFALNCLELNSTPTGIPLVQNFRKPLLNLFLNFKEGLVLIGPLEVDQSGSQLSVSGQLDLDCIGLDLGPNALQLL